MKYVTYFVNVALLKNLLQENGIPTPASSLWLLTVRVRILNERGAFMLRHGSEQLAQAGFK